MALEFLATSLAGPIIKHIAKLAFGEGLLSEIAGGSSDWLAGKISKYEAGKAELSVKAIAEQTVQELQPLFERSKLTAEQQRNVTDALGRTLNEVDVAKIVIDERFETQPVFRRLDESRPAARDDLDEAPYGLYRQALRAIAAALCRIGSKLPSFHKHSAKATLDALDQLAGQIAVVLEGIGRTEEGVQDIKKRLADEAREKTQIADENERFYRAALRGDVAKIRLFGLDFEEGTPDELPLEIAYIPLQLTLGEVRSRQSSPLLLEYAEVLDLMPFLGNRLLIEGLGGSGKSTLLQWTALKALDIQAGTAVPPDRGALIAKLNAWMRALPEAERTKFNVELHHVGSPGEPDIGASFFDRVGTVLSGVGRSIKNVGVRWCVRTPFLVRLREFSDGQLPKPEALPRLIAAEAPGTAEAWVWKTLTEGRALILLDGIDEVPGESRESLAKSIGNYLIFLQQYNTQLIVTSRPAAVQEPGMARAVRAYTGFGSADVSGRR